MIAQMKIAVILCLSLGLLAETVRSYPDLKQLLKASRRHNHHRCKPGPGPSPSPIKDPKPCKNKVSNGTVVTPEGTIHCEVPTREQLLNQLKEIGGANRYYVAITEEEADNFPNLLPNVNLSDIYYCDPSTPASHPWWRPRRKCHKEYQDSAEKRSDIPGSTVTNIRCFTDGSRDQDTGGMILCNRCQQKRELPTGYFPSFFNELSCGDGKIGGISSDTCNSGSGDCIQKFLYMPILKYKEDKCTTTGGITTCKQVWVPATGTIRSCCECQF